MTDPAKPPSAPSDAGPLPTDEEAIRAAVAALAARLAPDGPPASAAPPATDEPPTVVPGRAAPPAADEPTVVPAPQPAPALTPTPPVPRPAPASTPVPVRLSERPRVAAPPPPQRGAGRVVAILLLLLLLIGGGVWLMRDHPQLAALFGRGGQPADGPRQASAPPPPRDATTSGPTTSRPDGPAPAPRQDRTDAAPPPVTPADPAQTATPAAPTPPVAVDGKPDAPPNAASPVAPGPAPVDGKPDAPPAAASPATPDPAPVDAKPDAPPATAAPAPSAVPVEPRSDPADPARTASAPGGAPGGAPVGTPVEAKPDVPPAVPASRSAPGPADAAPPAAPAAIAPPTFDNVFIRDGRAVIAGRAAPDSRIEVMAGDRTIGTARADDRGEWVVIVDAPLSPGGHELRLVQTPPGGAPVPSDRTVAVIIPAPVAPAPASASPQPASPQPVTAQPGTPQAASPQSATPPAASPQPASPQPASPQSGPTTPTAPSAVPALSAPPRAPLVVATPTGPGGGASQVLQSPPLARSGDLVLRTVDYDDAGRMTIAGQASPGETVRVYVNNEPVGVATAGDDGKWILEPGRPTPHGPQRLRVDRLTAGGPGVAQRLEVPFERVAVKPGEAVTIVRGDNLWNIARGALGSGERYTVIYEANRNQIRDPNLIYPGQVFVIPKPR